MMRRVTTDLAGAMLLVTVALGGCAMDPGASTSASGPAAPSGATADGAKGGAAPKDDNAETVALSAIARPLVARAANFIASIGAAKDGPTSWRGAQLGPKVVPVYRADLDGPAYYEFRVLTGSGSDAGYVLVSTGDFDTPVPTWRATGGTLTDDSTKMAAAKGYRAQRFLRLSSTIMGSEDAAGRVFAPGEATLDGEPIVGADWSRLRPKFAARLAAGNEEARAQTKALWAAEAEPSAQALKRLIAAVPDQAAPVSVILKPPPDGGGGPYPPPCTSCFPHIFEFARAREDAADGDDATPLYNQFAHTFFDGYRMSGCGPTAFAEIVVWISKQRFILNSPDPAAGWDDVRMGNLYSEQGPWGSMSWGHWYWGGDYDGAGTPELSNLIFTLNDVLRTHISDPGPDGVPGGATNEYDWDYFRDDFLASRGVPVWMSVHRGTYDERINAIYASLRDRHTPLVARFPWEGAKHIAVMDGLEWETVGSNIIHHYVHMNMGWQGLHNGYYELYGQFGYDLLQVAEFWPNL